MEVDSLSSGEVGCFICGIKDVRDTKVGDTICAVGHPELTALSGFQEVKPMVFAGLYPIESDEYNDLKEALEKLRLNDSAFTFEPETSSALGFGFSPTIALVVICLSAAAGVIPITADHDTAGPMTRTVNPAWSALTTIRRAEMHDTSCSAEGPP